jgi:hypothetical protein
MKSNVVLMWVLGGYFLVAGVLYIVWNHIAGNPFDPVPTLAILLSAGLAGLIGFYLNAVNRSQGGILLPEDRPYADIDDGDPEIGYFSPWSWWPFILGLGGAVVILGLAVGVWIALFAIPVVLIALAGWSFEYYRGNFGR